jgi:hypothetical protein
MKHVKWVEEAIERNPRDASARVSLLRMLRDAGDAARLDRARREFAAVLPLPPALWLEWLEERLAALRAAAADPASEAFQQCAGEVMELSDRSVTVLWWLSRSLTACVWQGGAGLAARRGAVAGQAGRAAAAVAGRTRL